MNVSISKYRTVFINLLTAIGISLIANFNFFLIKIMPAPPGGYRGWMRQFMESDFILYVNFFFYLFFALILLCILTVNVRRKRFNFLVSVIVCVAVAVVFYFCAPVFHPRTGASSLLINGRNLFDPSILTKVAFTLILCVLYGKIFQLIYQKQRIVLENELLKNENLQSTYNTLINQMNPHFFFNSLNSLAMLVREKHNDQALVYIDRLSETFRYIIQNGQSGGTTLEEELKFVDAYKYLLEVRYEGKLFFNIDVEERYRDWTMPSLTIQPLIENIVKHNVITRSRPMNVSIRTVGGALLVSNPVSPKIHDGDPSGIGLENLSHRYKLLTGKDITVTNDGETFTVELPLTEPEKHLEL
ncbi:MAG: histidine kinase [Alistipes sp.]|nr:histidine kinase [Alistipes sp.]